MLKGTKIFNFVLSTFLLSGLTIATFSLSSCAADQKSPAKSDDELFIRHLLKLDFDSHKAAPQGYDSLAEYKKWEALYMKVAKTGAADQTLSYEDAKKLLLIGFIAKNNQDAATMESLNSDLVPLFEKNRDVMLKAMSELPFVVAPACDYMNRYFGWEDQNADKKPAFLKNHQKAITDKLGPANSKTCLERFN